MVRASAGKTSRPNASRTSSTTASRAKPRKKEPLPPDDNWTARDAEDAALQGWELWECIDEKTLKIFFEVFSFGSRFEKDALARAFVMERNKAGDELAIKALRAVFRTKAAPTPRRKK